MKETSKAMRRRWAEREFPWNKIFRGDIIDVGSGDDPLDVVFDGSSFSVTHFDLPDGGGDDLTDFFLGRHFDTIHGSQVLEHAKNPVHMLASWIKCLNPHGYIVATVPDWKLYEKETWPSKFNAGHRSIWSMDWKAGEVIHIAGQKPLSCYVVPMPQWLDQFTKGERPVEILRCQLITTNYDHALGPEIDQTLPFDNGVECFIEFVLHRV